MSNGITTILSRITIPEKVADVQERLADNRQNTMIAYSQQQMGKMVSEVHKKEKATALQKIKHEKNDANKKKKKKSSQEGNGDNIDMQA